MLDALRAAGFADYSLFLAPDGLLVGVVTTEDLDAALARMAATEANARWQASMASFFALPPGDRPDTGFVRLREVFHLD